MGIIFAGGIVIGEYNVPYCCPCCGIDAHPPHAINQMNITSHSCNPSEQLFSKKRQIQLLTHYCTTGCGLLQTFDLLWICRFAAGCKTNQQQVEVMEFGPIDIHEGVCWSPGPRADVSAVIVCMPGVHSAESSVPGESRTATSAAAAPP